MQATCSGCPAGFYCLENATDYSQKICPVGHYCPAGTSRPHEFPCPKGTFNPVNGSDGIEDCLSCSPGKYCEGEHCLNKMYPQNLFLVPALTEIADIFIHFLKMCEYLLSISSML